MAIALTIVAIIAAAFFFYKKKTSAEAAKPRHTPIETQQEHVQSLIDSKRFWGFYIDYPDEAQCCQAVLGLNKKQFPINSVPALPLEGCSQPGCHCKHAGLVEKRKPRQQRRKTNDRRDDIRFEEVSDRRSHMDRRSDNWVNHEQ